MKYILKSVFFVGLVFAVSTVLATAEPAKDLPKLKAGFSYEAPDGESYTDRMKPGGPLVVYVENSVVNGAWAQFQDYMREDYQLQKTSSDVMSMKINGY